MRIATIGEPTETEVMLHLSDLKKEFRKTYSWFVAGSNEQRTLIVDTITSKLTSVALDKIFFNENKLRNSSFREEYRTLQDYRKKVADAQGKAYLNVAGKGLIADYEVYVKYIAERFYDKGIR